ncbi:MAG: hypothetical protein HWD82_10430 [Flavobacteriaceae bacterium]|nr:hypothetical protein [Flavobacteriaceae bacterium]
MKLKFSIGLILFLFFNNTFSQNPSNKWVAGIHMGSVLYNEVNALKVGGAYIDQIPRLTLSRYMFNNITFEAGIGFSVIDSQKYTTFDGIAKYDFGTSYDNIVPYVLIGGSFISAEKFTPTLNFGVGNTFWVYPNYGINIQIMYKFSETRFESQTSHIYPTVGIIYSFKPRNMRTRLWDMKH